MCAKRGWDWYDFVEVWRQEKSQRCGGLYIVFNVVQIYPVTYFPRSCVPIVTYDPALLLPK